MASPSRSEAERLRGLLQTDAISRFSLENGLTVVHLEDHSAELVSAQLWVRTGSIHEGRHLGAGVSHYLEHLLFKGTARRADGVIAREVQENGGYVNAYTTFDRTVYYLDLPSEKLDFALDILADMAFHARLDEDEIRREQGVILREIAMGMDDPDRQVSRAAFRNAFKTHPYRFPVIGERGLFTRIEPEDLRAYYRARYVPANMVLVVVGAVDEETLRASLAETFEPAEARAVEPIWIPPESPQLAQRTERLRQEVNICRGVMAFRIPHLAHPDAAGLDLLSTILGHGQSSVLWQALREDRSLVHHVAAATWNPGTSGLFWISYTCEPAQREAAETGILATIAGRLEKGFTAAEVEKARRLAWVGEINARKTISGQAGRLGAAEVVLGDISFPESYLRSLERVTPEALGQLVRRYIHPDGLTSVSLNAPTAEPAVSRARATRQALGDFSLKTLPNGARLLWQRDSRLPKVHLRFSGLGGGAYEAPAKRGITALMATLMARDTQWRRSAEVAQAIESVGGSFHEFAGNNTFGLSLEVLSGDLELGRGLLEDAVLSPAWHPGTFERERAAQLADLREAADDIVEYGRLAVRRHFFGEHPLAIEPEGIPETVAALTLDDIRAHYNRLMVAPNLVLTAVGDLDPDRDLAPLEAFLMDLPPWAFLPADRPLGEVRGGDFKEVLEREQTVVFLAFPDVGLAAEVELAAQLLDAICSDMSSELFRAVREERGLAYFVATSRTLGLYAGQFTFYAGTRPDAADEVLEALRTEARRLREAGPSQAELDRARSRLKARLRMSLQSPGSRAAQASLNLHYGKPVNHWHEYDARLDAITVADLREFAGRFTEAGAVAYRVGPSQSSAVPAGSR